jgi:hypothetical protein
LFKEPAANLPLRPTTREWLRPFPCSWQ